MAVVITGTGKDNIQKSTILRGTMVFSGNYATNGEATDFTKAVMPIGEGVPEGTTSPKNVKIWGISGYQYAYNPATKKTKVFPSAPTGTIALGGGLKVYSEADIKGAVTTNVGIAGGALPTNGALLSALAAANNTTAFTIATSPDIGRNVSVSFKNTVAGASTGNAVDVVIVGTYLGTAQTETISFTVLELTSTAQNEVATKYGSKPFDKITSITPSAAQPASWQHAAGIGSKIGLPWPLATGVEADVKKLTKNAADLAVTGLVDVTNYTVNFGTLADNDDVSMEYMALNSGLATWTPGAQSELSAGAYPAGITGDTVSFEATLPKGL